MNESTDFGLDEIWSLLPHGPACAGHVVEVESNEEKHVFVPFCSIYLYGLVGKKLGGICFWRCFVFLNAWSGRHLAFDS